MISLLVRLPASSGARDGMFGGRKPVERVEPDVVAECSRSSCFVRSADGR